MTKSGLIHLRQDRRRRITGLAMVCLALVGYAATSSYLPQVAYGLLQIIGTILLLSGTEAWVAEDFIKIGFTTIPKKRITRVDMEEDSVCLHWTGKNGVTRSYLFRSAPYHPDDWKLLQDHLVALGVSRFDERDFRPEEY
ncbi:MAG: hypothetical protein EOP85_05135 [Verrucomicrobiaceae bacterium]|nr:MAG: hypothetical protein EOP85_05135 [Verrucomicrobiaceae bacterium]